MSLNTLYNPLNAWGKTDKQSKLPSTIVPFESGGAITAGRIVAIATDGTGQVTQATTGTTASLIVGVALDTVTTSGKVCRIVTAGYASALTNGSPSVGAILKRGTTTAGSLDATATPAAGEVVAVAISASASNVADVWVCKAP